MESFAAGAAGNFWNMAFQWWQNKENQKWQEKMFGISRDQALQDREHAETYNDPSSQMARLKKAGLNPNLIYGKADANISAPPTRQADLPSMDRPAPQMDMGALINPLLKQQELNMMQELTTARVDLLKAQSLKAVSDTKGVDLNNSWAASTLMDRISKAEWERNNEEEKYQWIGSQIGLNNRTSEGREKENKWIDLNNMVNNAKGKSEISLNIARAKHEGIKMLQTEAETANTKQQKEMINQQIERLKQIQDLAGWELFIRGLGVGVNALPY